MKLTIEHLKAIGAAQKPKGNHPVLQSLHAYQENGQTIAVATDSYQLYEVRGTMPKGEGHEESMLIPTAPIDFTKRMLKNSKYVNPEAEFAPEDVIAGDSTMHFEQTEGKFPEYKRMVLEPLNSQKIKGQVILDPKYLEEVGKFFKGETAITLEVRGDLEAVVFRSVVKSEAYDADITKTAIVMPQVKPGGKR